MAAAPVRFINAAAWPLTIWTSLSHFDDHPADDYVERTSPIVATAVAFWLCFVALIVLASTYARWFSDESEDNEATWAFLDARIENVMQFEKFKAQLKPVGESMQSALGVAARFRYGR